MRTRTGLFWIAVLTLPVQCLRAQPESREFGLGVLVGGAKMNGDIEKSSMGFHAGAFLEYLPGANVGLSLAANHAGMISGLNAITTSVYGATVSSNLFLASNRPFRPFLTLGFTTLYYSARDQHGARIRRRDGTAYRGWTPALNIGGGLRLNASRQWALNFKLSYNFAKNDGLDGIVAGDKDVFFTAAVALVRRFYSELPKLSRAGSSSRRAGKPWQNAHGGLEVEEVTAIKKRQSGNQQNEGTPTTVFSSDIYFKPGSNILQARSKVQLDRIYQYLKDHPDEGLELLRKDPEAMNDTKKALALARAKAVKRYLVKRGIAAKRVKIGRQGR